MHGSHQAAHQGKHLDDQGSTQAVLAASTTSTDPDPTKNNSRVWGGISVATPEAEALVVDVTAMQFAFIFHYPEGNIITGELHIPADRPVSLHMEAKDVIHAFWVPQFRLKQDVIPGQPTLLSFTATRPGTYPIVCAELCGPYHGGMRSSVVVHESADFDSWLSKNTPPAPATVASAASTPTA
jgi:cytochrome c oxidase subunit 2